ncbi:MAG: hypothetical protein WDN27_06870 [Candidatus Saccharibacteria bacterium]
MKKIAGDQRGVNVLLLPLVLLLVLFLGAVGFSVWAYGSQQDYKNNTDAKIATAVAADKQSVQAADAKQYAEAAKSPLKSYTGPDAYGSVKVEYPKTWSAYVDTSSSSTPLDAYFHEDYVPSTQSKLTYNLRVQVDTQSYDNVLSQYASKVKNGTVTATPYSLPNVTGVTGTMLAGNIFNSSQSGAGTIVLLPLRANTLEIWTESNDYLSDFNTYILPNLTFSP